jgi:hypothetical protein
MAGGVTQVAEHLPEVPPVWLPHKEFMFFTSVLPCKVTSVDLNAKDVVLFWIV